MFKWDEKYSVGIQVIDDQHKEIFRILDKLYSLLKEGKPENLLRGIIPELENYTIFHFQKEEAYFKRFNYADSDEHISEHKEFIRRINEIKLDIEQGRSTIGFDLMIYLKIWIDHHILTVDKKYVSLFGEKVS